MIQITNNKFSRVLKGCDISVIKKPLHYNSITVISLYVAPPLGLEPRTL